MLEKQDIDHIWICKREVEDDKIDRTTRSKQRSGCIIRMRTLTPLRGRYPGMRMEFHLQINVLARRSRRAHVTIWSSSGKIIYCCLRSKEGFGASAETEHK